MYKPKYFSLYELVPREIYESVPSSEHDRIWFIFDERALTTLDRLRIRYGRATVNNWRQGGDLQLRGYRPPTSSVGAKYSQHRYGRGFDSNYANATPDEIRSDIENHATEEAFEFITCIEMNITWLHFDTRNWNTHRNGILKVYP